MYMIIIKIDCCGRSQTLCSLRVWMLSDAMWAKGLRTCMLKSPEDKETNIKKSGIKTDIECKVSQE